MSFTCGGKLVTGLDNKPLSLIAYPPQVNET